MDEQFEYLVKAHQIQNYEFDDEGKLTIYIILSVR